MIDSGIYLCIWANQKFLSLILYTCTDFNDTEAIQKTDEYFRFSEMEHARF